MGDAVVAVGCALAMITAATQADAQSAPRDRIAGDPCPPSVTVPPEMMAYLHAALDPSVPPVARPVATYAKYHAAVQAAKATDWAQLCYYRRDNARLATRLKSERRIVYIGDSITELWSIADPAFFTNGRIDRGISGQTTGQMLVRFQADVIALHPTVVHILAGGNDLAGNNGPEAMEDIHNNIAAMATLARAVGVRVVLASLTPTAPSVSPASAGIGGKAQSLSRWIESYARRTHATFVNYRSTLMGADGTLPAALTFDGIHLNLPAYRLIEPLSVAATDCRKKRRAGIFSMPMQSRKRQPVRSKTPTRSSRADIGRSSNRFGSLVP